jgi:hypothetical protein
MGLGGIFLTGSYFFGMNSSFLGYALKRSLTTSFFGGSFTFFSSITADLITPLSLLCASLADVITYSYLC